MNPVFHIPEQHRRKAKLPKQHGFTLMELMVVIAVIAILGLVSIPAIASWLPDYRLRSATREVVSAFQKAKLEAVKRGEDVIIQFNPGAYSPAGQVGSYRMFVDNGAGGGVAGNQVQDGNEPSISLQVNMPENVSLINAVTFAGNWAGFNRRGLPVQNNLGSVQLKNNNLKRFRIVLSIAGNLRLERSYDDGATWN